ncbi:thioredoxin reductase [Alphaproteobacteria bacterium]|nr:thioredoxin reductase [Alphaproteobacteria bacterium]GHT00238.1 thioredoxin reductase [Alphaproteobacteria bacterium]
MDYSENFSADPVDIAPVLIVGAGPAGYTAAIYVARAGLQPVLFTGAQIGGQLTQTTEVENFPGFPDPILGGDLVERMRVQAEKLGTRLIFERILDIQNNPPSVQPQTKETPLTAPFLCLGEKTVCPARAVILATGAIAKGLNVPGEAEFHGYGVSSCATCDGFFYRNKTVAIVGGGNTAAIDALFLPHHARKVFFIHRCDSLRAEKTLQERLFKNEKIEFMWDSVVEEICGETNPRKVTHILLKNVKTEKKTTLSVDGLFVAIGHSPQTDFLKDKVERDKEGYIIRAPFSTKTSVPGIFAAGDVADPTYKQAITAASLGCMAALDAQHFLEESL